MAKNTTLAVAKAKAVEIVQESVGELHNKQSVSHVWQTLGGAKVAEKLGLLLNAQALRAIETIKDQKLYLALGYETFQAFLNEDPESPMTYAQFNDRINRLQAEGEEAFNLMNTLRIPVYARKQLGPGAISVEGEVVNVGEKQIPVTDRKGILEVIKHLAKEQQRLTKVADQGAKDFEKLKRKVLDAEASKPTAPLGNSPVEQSLFVAVAAVGAFAQEVSKVKLSPEELQSFYDDSMRPLSQQWRNLIMAFEELGADTFGDDVQVSDAELEALVNDGEEN